MEKMDIRSMRNERIHKLQDIMKEWRDDLIVLHADAIEEEEDMDIYDQAVLENEEYLISTAWRMMLDVFYKDDE